MSCCNCNKQICDRSIPKWQIFLGWFYLFTTEVNLCKSSELEISNHNKINYLNAFRRCRWNVWKDVVLLAGRQGHASRNGEHSVSTNFRYNLLATKYALHSGIIVQSHLWLPYHMQNTSAACLWWEIMYFFPWPYSSSFSPLIYRLPHDKSTR